MISSILFCLAYFYAQILPVPVLWWLGRLIGVGVYALDFRHRSIALRNLRIAFGDQWDEIQIRRTARESFCRQGSNFLTLLKIGPMPGEKAMRFIGLRGREHVEKLLGSGRGVILVAAHMGSWELYAQACASLKPWKFSTIYQKLKNPFVEKTLHELRTRCGVDFIEKSNAWPQVTARLRQGQAVGILVDQHAGDHGIWIPFFGRLASTSNLVGLLARKTGAAIVPINCFQDAPARWVVEFGPEIPTRILNIPLTVTELTVRINETVEKAVRRNPEDWFWMHNRWKTPRPRVLLKNYKRGVYVEPGAKLQPFKVLVRTSNWLGDAVLNLPAVSQIKKGRPDCHLTILTPDKLADLWHANPDVDEVIHIKPDEPQARLVERIMQKQFDIGVVLPNSPRSALPLFFAEVPRRVGYAGSWRRWLLNQVVPDTRRRKSEQHQVEDYLGIVRELGGDGEIILPPLKFDAPLDSFKIPAGAPLVVVAPGAEFGPAKQWPPERFAETCDLVARKTTATFVFTGTASDYALSEDIIQRAGIGAMNLAGKTSLAELGTLLRHARVVLCNDSGAMHLAAVVGTPVVAIFGSTEPQLTGPLGHGHAVLRNHVECSPCFLRDCPLDFRCLKGVAPLEAADAILARLKDTP